jgi:hypothetical protein
VIVRADIPRFDPPLRALAERACLANGVGEGGVEHLRGLCGRWDILVLIGVEDGQPVGLLVCELPNPFMLLPLISFAYNEGHMETGQEMFRGAREWVQAHGYSKVTMLNRSRAQTDVWARGVEIRLRAKEVARASMITVELNHDERRRE